MIRVIGMGPGDIRYLTFIAVEKIYSSEKIIAFGRIASTAEVIKRPVTRVDSVKDIVKHIESDKDTAILASGDPCFYGIVEYLKSIDIYIDEIIPGLSSFQYMMSKLQKSWNDAEFISLHGRDGDINKALNRRVSVILTDKTNTPNVISKKLHSIGARGRIYAGFNLSYEDEYIDKKNIGDEIEEKSFLSVVVVENEMD